MLVIVTTVKLVTEIGWLALIGQCLLGFLAGERREGNVCYRILVTMGKPFVLLARGLTPRFVLSRHLPLVALLMLSFVWLGATILKIQTCLELGVASCK